MAPKSHSVVCLAVRSHNSCCLQFFIVISLIKFQGGEYWPAPARFIKIAVRVAQLGKEGR